MAAPRSRGLPIANIKTKTFDATGLGLRGPTPRGIHERRPAHGRPRRDLHHGQRRRRARDDARHDRRRGVAQQLEPGLGSGTDQNRSAVIPLNGVWRLLLRHRWAAGCTYSTAKSGNIVWSRRCFRSAPSALARAWGGVRAPPGAAAEGFRRHQRPAAGRHQQRFQSAVNRPEPRHRARTICRAS